MIFHDSGVGSKNKKNAPQILWSSIRIPSMNQIRSAPASPAVKNFSPFSVIGSTPMRIAEIGDSKMEYKKILPVLVRHLCLVPPYQISAQSNNKWPTYSRFRPKNLRFRDFGRSPIRPFPVTFEKNEFDFRSSRTRKPYSGTIFGTIPPPSFAAGGGWDVHPYIHTYAMGR